MTKSLTFRPSREQKLVSSAQILIPGRETFTFQNVMFNANHSTLRLGCASQHLRQWNISEQNERV